MDKIQDLQRFNFKLTALWALSEIGGSLLNTLKLPFFGMLISVCSVLILALFYQANRENERPIAIALLVVSVIKFAFNPFVSPLAFLALFFQVGFCMMAFRYIRPFKTACITAGIACLLHAAAEQLFLRHVEIDFWSLKSAFLPTAMLDRLIMDLVKSNPLFEILYAGLFASVGWLTGLMACWLPPLMLQEQSFLLSLETLPKPVLTEKQIKKAEKKKAKRSKYGLPRILIITGILAFCVGRFEDGIQLIQIAFLWLVTFTNFFQKFVVPKVQSALNSVFYPQYKASPEGSGDFAQLSEMIYAAWHIAKGEKTWPARLVRFIPLIFALALQDTFGVENAAVL